MPTMSQLDYPQVIKSVYDPINQALQVSVVAGGGGGSSNASVGPTGTPAPVQATELGAVDGLGNLQHLLITPAGALEVDGSAITQPISAVSLPLPSGASTSALQTSGNASLASIDSKLTSPLSSVISGFTLSQFVRNDYTSTAVTTAAYVQLIASTTSLYQELEIFDSSGQTLQLALGAAASEVPFMLLTPGGNGRISFKIPASSRLSIKAVSANASVGELDINLRG